MQQRFVTYAAAALMAAVTPVVLAQSNSSAQQPGAGQSQSAASAPQQNRQDQQAPEGFILLNERTVYLMANEPQLHFTQAHMDLSRGEAHQAAEEIRLAAAYFDMQSARPHAKDQSQLKQQADELRQLAQRIDKPANPAGQSARQNDQGQQTAQDQQANRADEQQIKQIDQQFAKAEQILAKHHQELADWELQNDRFLAAGYDLKATGMDFRQAIIWSGKQPPRDAVALLDNTRKVSENLINNNLHEFIHQNSGQSNQQASAQTSQNSGNEAQQAGSKQSGSANQANTTQSDQSRQPLVVGNPKFETTTAEARNDAEHARKLVKALGQEIDQLAGELHAQPAGSHQQGQASSKNQNSQSENSQSSSSNHNASGGSQR